MFININEIISLVYDNTLNAHMKAHPEITGVLINVMCIYDVFIDKKGLAEANPLRKEFGFLISLIPSNQIN